MNVARLIVMLPELESRGQTVFAVKSQDRKRVVWWSDRFVTVTTADWPTGQVVLVD